MSWINQQVAQCDKCGHKWIPEEGEPKRCAKCKSPTWNSGGVRQETKNKILGRKPSREKATALDSVSENKGKITRELTYVKNED